MRLNNDKYYKTCPKHNFWFNDGNVEKIIKLSKDLNHWESINIETKKKNGAYVIGYMLRKEATKATEEDFNNVTL